MDNYIDFTQYFVCPKCKNHIVHFSLEEHNIVQFNCNVCGNKYNFSKVNK